MKECLRMTGLFVLFCAVLLTNEACQFRPKVSVNDQINIQDEIRKIHADELLNQKENNNVEAFNGDEKFVQYVTAYVKKKNRNINAESFTQTLMNLSQKYAYDPIFVLAIIQTESGFKPNAIGSAGEIGLMQLKPETAEWICGKQNIPWKGAQALKDPEYNITVGTAYFKYLKNTLNSKSLKYINAYNVGLGSLKRMAAEDLKKHPYFVKVMGNYLNIYSKLNKIKVAAI